MFGLRTYAHASLFGALAVACAPSPRDVIPESRDVHVTTGPPADEGYVYVARRPHGIVALAEARHMATTQAIAFVDQIANALERCATQLATEGQLVEGAARVVAIASPDGTPVLSVRLAPGEDVTRNALVCLLAPIRATTLPVSNGNRSPGLALEATWGPSSGQPGSAADPKGKPEAP